MIDTHEGMPTVTRLSAKRKSIVTIEPVVATHNKKKKKSKRVMVAENDPLDSFLVSLTTHMLTDFLGPEHLSSFHLTHLAKSAKSLVQEDLKWLQSEFTRDQVQAWMRAEEEEEVEAKEEDAQDVKRMSFLEWFQNRICWSFYPALEQFHKTIEYFRNVDADIVVNRILMSETSEERMDRFFHWQLVRFAFHLAL